MLTTHSWFRPLITTLAVVTATALGASPTQADLLVGSGASAANSQVLRYSDTGEFLGVFVAPGNNLVQPRGLAFGPDGNLYVACVGSDRILRYNGTTGAFIDTFIPPGAPTLHQPVKLIFRDDGFLYVSTFGNDGIPGSSVLRFNATTGAFANAFVPSGSGGLFLADGMAFGPDGNLYVSGVQSNASVLRYNGMTGAFLGVVASDLGFNSPRGLAFGPDGNLYVTIVGASGPFPANSVVRLDPTTGAFLGVFVASGSGGLNFPRDLEFLPDGSLLVAGYFSNQVLHYSNTGEFLNVAASGGGLFQATFFVQQAIPEPGTITLLGFGILGLLGYAGWRRRQA
jgi:DNA-binding beta-propeller fold protein YncE